MRVDDALHIVARAVQKMKDEKGGAFLDARQAIGDAFADRFPTVFAACQVFEFGSAGADRGLLKEFEAIIAVVIGGALLTGGYGSVIGAALGALIFGVVQQGLFFAGVESSLFRVFLGVILLFAVILNTYIRRIITGER